MLPRERYAVDLCMIELIESLKLQTPVLLHYMELHHVISYEERELIVRRNLFSAQQLSQLFYVLRGKDSGWTHFLLYLRGNNQSILADKLCKSAYKETDEPYTKRLKPSHLALFSCMLAQYYQQNYADVPTMGESPKHVKDVWVPLQIDGRCEKHLPVDRINHAELLNRLASDRRRNVALVKGDPGMGKTILAKKIAYDWAADYESNKAQQFSLVLAVPLRYAGKSYQFEQLAIDYFLSILDLEDIHTQELIGEIKQLKSRLLVILDGLDEYRSFSESAFKTLFAAPFQHSTANSNAPMTMVTCKLIITSRPYACNRVKEDYPFFRFVILPLAIDHLVEFVCLYCQTQHGVDKVVGYLQVNANFVIQVPLILTFVCYLADSVQEIPTNMTCLYDSFVRQMLKRENRLEKLAKSVDIQKWKVSNVVTSTSKLAYDGSAKSGQDNRVYEFTEKRLEKCRVTNDSFICGFLLHKYDFAKDCLMAEFPHRSIQEFFAALHCYQRMICDRQQLQADSTEMRVITKFLCDRDCQVGRFLFGICSLEKQLEQLQNWLSPSLLFSKHLWLQPATVITLNGLNLMDCSSDAQLTIGRRLFESLGAEEKLTDFPEIYPGDYNRKITNQVRFFSDEFKSTLHIQVLDKSPVVASGCWVLADNTKLARLVFVLGGPGFGFPTEVLGSKYTQIDTLIWDGPGSGWPLALDALKVLVPVKTLALLRSNHPVLEYVPTSICISYGQKTDLMLAQFQLQYDKCGRDELLNYLENEKFGDLTVDDRSEYKSVNKGEEGVIHRRLNVTVNDSSMSQSTLIFTLIRLSLQ